MSIKASNPLLSSMIIKTRLVTLVIILIASLHGYAQTVFVQDFSVNPSASGWVSLGSGGFSFANGKVTISSTSGSSNHIRSTSTNSFFDDGTTAITYSTNQGFGGNGANVGELVFRMDYAPTLNNGYKVTHYFDGTNTVLMLHRINNGVITSLVSDLNAFPILATNASNPFSVTVTNTATSVNFTFYYNGVALRNYIDSSSNRITQGYGIALGFLNNGTPQTLTGTFINVSAQRNTVNPGTAVVQNVISRNRLSNGDYRSVTGGGLANTNGAIFYVPKNGDASRSAIYSLLSPSGADYMESWINNESGYSNTGVLGYGYATGSVVPGLAQVIRLVNGMIGDHATVNPSESIASYNTTEPLPYYGYMRYNGNFSEMCTVTGGVANRSTPNQISAGGVTIESNAASGGALWHWTWNGVQFINNHDNGRQIQTSIFFYDPYANLDLYPTYDRAFAASSGFTGFVVNPTEAGSQYSLKDGYEPLDGQGSPCLTISNNTTNPNSPTQTTSSIPLEWDPRRLGGGDSNPVVWSDVAIGKEITLNHSPDGVNRNWPVALYKTNITLPQITANATAQVPTGYLRGDFHYFYTYDAGSSTLTQVTPTPAFQNNNVAIPILNWVPSSGWGGVIISDSTNGTNSHAMGVFAHCSAQLPSNGVGSVYGFNLWDHRYYSTGNTGETDYNCSQWEAVAPGGTFPAGKVTYSVYIMTGTVSQVCSYMNTLYTLLH